MNNRWKINVKSMENRFQNDSNFGLKLKPKYTQNTPKLAIKRPPRRSQLQEAIKKPPNWPSRSLWERLGGLLGRLETILGANMTPTWLPKRTPKRSKFEAFFQSIFECLWRSEFLGFWWIFEAKMDASWPHVGPQNRSQLRKAIFWKNLVFPMEKQ